MSEFRKRDQDVPEGILGEGYRKELKRQADRKEALSKTLAKYVSADTPIVFEAGCGHGHWLTSYASVCPDRLCIGIDLIASQNRESQCQKIQAEFASAVFY